MTEEDFVKFLNMADHVEYALEESISYRDADGVLQTLDPDADDSEDTDDGEDDTDSDDTDSDDTDGTEGSLTAREAMALMTYLDGTEREESARLERTSAYMQAFFTSLFKENKSSVIYKKYTNLAQFSEDRNLSDEERIIKQLDPENITIRILQGAESNGVFLHRFAESQTAGGNAGKTGGGSRWFGPDKSRPPRRRTAGRRTPMKKIRTVREIPKNIPSNYIMPPTWQAWPETGKNIWKKKDTPSVSWIIIQDEGPLSTTRIIVSEEGMGEDLRNTSRMPSLKWMILIQAGIFRYISEQTSTDVGGDDKDDVSGG